MPRIGKDSKEKVSIYRDGEKCGDGVSRMEAEQIVSEWKTAYPDVNFTIVPCGVVKPGNKGRK